MSVFNRDTYKKVLEMLSSPSPVFQVLAGPRQVGKTTMAKHLMTEMGVPAVYASADAALPRGPEWIESQWSLAITKAGKGQPVLLVLDEVQKVRGWAEELKRLWDSRATETDIRLLILGSSVLLLRDGLSTSLTGRFFLHRCPHWSYGECRAAFGWTLDQWLYFGGYPGAARFAHDESTWRQYVADSLVETVVAKDVLQTARIAKPALLRSLFALVATFPAQVLSYNKMLGQLHDAGNTTTLAHYLQILDSAMLASGLEMYWHGRSRKRGSSPKLVAWNNAIVSALSARTMQQSLEDSSWRGRLVENAAIAHVLNGMPSADTVVTYWHDGRLEVDFVVTFAGAVWGVEVKSGREGKNLGLQAFRAQYPKSRGLLLGGGGVPLEEFFLTPASEWFRP